LLHLVEIQTYYANFTFHKLNIFYLSSLNKGPNQLGRKKNYKWAGHGGQACNPSSLRGADWEDCGLRPAWAKKKIKKKRKKVH
jgi:hypothetical protein